MITLIIGNGFDLDLGLKTRYAEFIESDYFKLMDDSPLKRLIIHKQKKENWVDLENCIKETAVSFSDEIIMNYLEEYNGLSKTFGITKINDHINIYGENQYKNDHYLDLCNKLQNYLYSIDKFMNKDSYAFRTISFILKNFHDYEIYNFNYTPLTELLSKQNITIDESSYFHIHGEIKTGIVLGCEEDASIHNSYIQSIKPYSRHYRENRLSYALQKSDKVIFFGHSFGKSDFSYFQRFLNSQADHDLKQKDPKQIVIITYNYESLVEIFKNMRAMEISIDYLRADNNLKILFTDGLKKEEFEELLHSNNSSLINDFFYNN